MIGIRTFSDRKGSDLLFVRINKPIACFLFVLVIIYWYSHWMEDLPMSQPEHVYIAIDSKSFYASVECRERKLDPLTTNLVVADPSRTEKTICLAVSSALKANGIPGRPRMF